MMEKLKKQPIELWFGLIATGAYFIEQDKTLLIMGLIYLTTAKILLEMRQK